MSGLGSTYVILFFVALLDWTRGKWMFSSALSFFSFACPIVCAGVWGWSLSVRAPGMRSATLFMLGSTLLVVSLWFANGFTALVRSIAMRATECGPDTLAIERCLNLRLKLHMESQRWHELRWRREISLQIEAIAQSINGCGTALRRIGDETSAVWAESRMARIATSIRDKKKWLVTPRPDTFEELSNAVGQLLVALLNSDWDSLPEMESPSLSKRDLLRAGVLRLRGVLVSVSLPALLFWIVQYSPFAFHSPVRDYVTGFLMLWVLVVLLSAADPHYASRVESFRNMVQIFPFGKKEK